MTRTQQRADGYSAHPYYTGACATGFPYSSQAHLVVRNDYEVRPRKSVSVTKNLKMSP